MATYKPWKLGCDQCEEEHTITDWEDRLPTRCLCGGMLFMLEIGKRVAPIQREEIMADLEETYG